MTDTIAIRPWNEGDLDLLFGLMGDPAMTTYLGGPESDEKIRSRHERYCGVAAAGTGKMFVITVGEEATPAGSVGYWHHEYEGEQVWETGWSVLPAFQGRGIAAAGTELAIQAAAADGPYRFIFAYPRVENGPSNGLCRKLGFELLGEADLEYPPGNPGRFNVWRRPLR